MNISSCCQNKMRVDEKVRRPASLWRYGGEIASWIVPSVTLVLIPKCPMCVAAYIALATGIGISLPLATYLRVTLIVLCVASLTFISVKRLHILLTKEACQS